MTSFSDWLFGEDQSPRTIMAYISDLAGFSAWYEQTNGEPLAVFTATDLREYKARLQAVDRAAPATINRKLAALRAYGRYLVDQGLADHNPAEAARGVRQQRLAPKWLDRKDQARLIRELERGQLAARTDPARRDAARNFAIVLLLLLTGLRVSELCALNCEDLKLRDRSGWLTVRSGKGDKLREVPLNLEARAALQHWFAWSPHKDNPPATAPAFMGRGGDRLQARGVQKMLAAIGRRAGVELSPHSLRHTFAHNLTAAGVGLDRIAALLGHSSLTTTAIYTTPGPHDLELAVASLEN